MRSVAFTTGRFNPFTRGHMKLIHALNDCDADVKLLFIVNGNKSSMDKSKNPLDVCFRRFVIKTFVQDIYIDDIHNPYEIFDILEVQGLTPKYWVMGSDRSENYKRMINHADVDCKIIEVDRSNCNISATKAREAALQNDLVQFSNILPTHTDMNFVKNIMNKIRSSIGVKNGS